jgi:hypothetical protein
MVTSPTADAAEDTKSGTISVIRLLIAVGATAVVVFVLCWIGTFIPFSSPTHAYIRLFTTAEVNSIAALAEGTLWSLLFGALVGASFAIIFNATASIVRR